MLIYAKIWIHNLFFLPTFSLLRLSPLHIFFSFFFFSSFASCLPFIFSSSFILLKDWLKILKYFCHGFIITVRGYFITPSASSFFRFFRRVWGGGEFKWGISGTEFKIQFYLLKSKKLKENVRFVTKIFRRV